MPRFEHATARATYPRDRHTMRSCLDAHLAAHERARARRKLDLVLWRCRTVQRTREGVHSRVYDPTHHVDGPHPHRWGRRIFQSGKSDDASEGVPASARPHAHISARRALVRTLHTDTCLRSRCAGEAAHIDAAATAVTAGVVSAATAAAAPPPVASPVPLRCMLTAASVRATLGPGGDPWAQIARFLCVLLLAVTVGVRGWLAGRRESRLRALRHVCVLSLVCRLCLPWRGYETV